MGSTHFQDYVQNLNRLYLIEMIEAHSLARRPFKASLVINPVTGLAYDPPENEPDNT